MYRNKSHQTSLVIWKFFIALITLHISQVRMDWQSCRVQNTNIFRKLRHGQKILYVSFLLVHFLPLNFLFYQMYFINLQPPTASDAIG